MRMMEENRTLRVTLEQMEAQSSWHSGNTRDTSHAAGEHSPISFAQGPPGWVGVQRAALADQESFLRADTGNPDHVGTHTLTGIQAGAYQCMRAIRFPRRRDLWQGVQQLLRIRWLEQGLRGMGYLWKTCTESLRLLLFIPGWDLWGQGIWEVLGFRALLHRPGCPLAVLSSARMACLCLQEVR